MGNKITFRFLFIFFGLYILISPLKLFAQDCEDAKRYMESVDEELRKGIKNSVLNFASRGQGDQAYEAAKRAYEECLARSEERKAAAEAQRQARASRTQQTVSTNLATRCSEKGGRWDEQNTACSCPGSTGTENGTIDPMSSSPDETCRKAAAAPMEWNQTRCEQRKGRFDSESGNCLCGQREMPPGETCSAAEAAAAAQPSPQLVQCLDNWKQRAKDCDDAAKAANNNCDGDKSQDEGVKAAKELMGVAEKKTVADNAGKGAKELCAGMGILTSSIIAGLDLFKKTCDQDFSDCSAKCEVVNESTQGPVIFNDCVGHVRTDGAGNRNEADMTLMSNTIGQVNTASTNSRKICKVDAGKKQADLGKLFSGLDKSAQNAKICECKLSSSSTGNCTADVIPTPTDCLPGGRLAGSPACSVFAINCTDPVQRQTDACACAIGSDKCKPGQPPVNPNGSVFGADLKNNNGSGVSQFGAAGAGAGAGAGKGLGSGGFNLGLPKKPVEIANAPGVSAGGAAGVVAGGGSSGGSFGGSAGGLGSREPGEGLAGEDEGRSIGGAYGQAKSFFSGLLGKGKDDKNADKNKNKNGDNKKDDLDKFRPKGPIRGVAGSTGFGSKHMDIWKMMNIRYNDKASTFIQTK